MTPHVDKIRAFYSKKVFIHHLPSKAIPSFCIHICIHFVFILPNPESQNVRKYFQYIGTVYNTVSGVPPRDAPFRAIDLGEVALRPHPT